MAYFLYVKTHRDTGIKYLGYTKQNPYVYMGSGKYWKQHLKVHGNSVTTELLGAFDSLDDVSTAGLFWSTYWSVVESKEWANLKPEKGDGGFCPIPWNKGKTGLTHKPHSEKTKEKIRIANTGKTHSIEARRKISESLKGKPGRHNKPHTTESRDKMSKSHIGKPPNNPLGHNQWTNPHTLAQ